MKAYKVSYDGFAELDDRYLLSKNKAFESINYAINKICNEKILKYNNEYDFCTNEEFKKVYEYFIKQEIDNCQIIKVENNSIWYVDENEKDEIKIIYFYMCIDEDDGDKIDEALFFSIKEIEIKE